MLGQRYMNKKLAGLLQGDRSATMLGVGRGFYADVRSRPTSDGKRIYPEDNTSWDIYIKAESSSTLLSPVSYPSRVI